MNNRMKALVVLILAVTIFGCSKSQAPLADLKSFPTDNLSEIITQTDVTIDKDISTTRQGSVKITANEPRTVRLFETGPMDVDNARLIYKAKLRTDNVKGQAYLEMWCSFPGKGEFFFVWTAKLPQRHQQMDHCRNAFLPQKRPETGQCEAERGRQRNRHSLDR